MTHPLLILGAGGHGRVVADIALAAGHRIAGFVDARAEAPALPGLALFADREAARRAAPDARWVVAIGDNAVRARVAAELAAAHGATHAETAFATLVHPSATVSPHARLGPGTVVMAGAVINPGTVVGRHAIVNTGACIDHDNRIGDHASFAPRAVSGGNVTVGEGTAVGIGAVVRHGVTIGEWTVIGAGAVVLEDMPALVSAWGVPCRVVRARVRGERYL